MGKKVGHAGMHCTLLFCRDGLFWGCQVRTEPSQASDVQGCEILSLLVVGLKMLSNWSVSDIHFQSRNTYVSRGSSTTYRTFSAYYLKKLKTMDSRIIWVASNEHRCKSAPIQDRWVIDSPSSFCIPGTPGFNPRNVTKSSLSKTPSRTQMTNATQILLSSCVFSRSSLTYGNDCVFSANPMIYWYNLMVISYA